MAKKTVLNPHGLDQIYERRQPRRPHCLRQWIEKRGFRTDSEFADEIGADKGLVSRWLDDDSPATPGKEWQRKLGIFFGDEESPADIFRSPYEDWFSKFFRDKTAEDAERAKALLIAGFPEKNRKSK